MTGEKGRDRLRKYDETRAKHEELYGTPWGTLDTKADAKKWYMWMSQVNASGIFIERVVRSLLVFDHEDLERQYQHLILREKEHIEMFEQREKWLVGELQKLKDEVWRMSNILRANGLIDEDDSHFGRVAVVEEEPSPEIDTTTTPAADEWEEPERYDDTPQPNNNLEGNPYAV